MLRLTKLVNKKEYRTHSQVDFHVVCLFDLFYDRSDLRDTAFLVQLQIFVQHINHFLAPLDFFEHSEDVHVVHDHVVPFDHLQLFLVHWAELVECPFLAD